VRIIGGRFRGRWLPVAPIPGLRPTPDRVRETLFNWLQGRLQGARCLDLYAGSGALGLEAASRGAALVVLVERDPRLARLLEGTTAGLGADGVRIELSDAWAYLQRPIQPFDVVFLDPPFHRGLLPPVCQRLAEAGWLASGAFIYLESEHGAAAGQLPASWVQVRGGIAGEVQFRLLQAGEGSP